MRYWKAEPTLFKINPKYGFNQERNKTLHDTDHVTENRFGYGHHDGVGLFQPRHRPGS